MLIINKCYFISLALHPDLKNSLNMTNLNKRGNFFSYSTKILRNSISDDESLLNETNYPFWLVLNTVYNINGKTYQNKIISFIDATFWLCFQNFKRKKDYHFFQFFWYPHQESVSIQYVWVANLKPWYANLKSFNGWIIYALI